MEIHQDEEGKRILDVIMKTDAAYRGMIICYSEMVNIFFAALLAVSVSKIDNDVKDNFYKYAWNSIGTNIKIYNDDEHVDLRNNIGTIPLSEVGNFEQDIDDMRKERNKMGHCIPNSTDNIIKKDIALLESESYSIYFNKGTKQREFFSLKNDDVKERLSKK